jgi:type III secretion protein V
MVGKLALAFPHLVAETVGRTLSVFMLSDVLRRLVAEEVSIRNLRRIVMALAEWTRVESDPLYLTEYARAALKREITHRLTSGINDLVVFLLDPTVEDLIREATVHTPTGSYVNLPVEKLRSLLDAIRQSVASLGEGARIPAILTVMEIRAAVRRLVAPSMPLLRVTSYQELTPAQKIQPIGRITLDGSGSRRDFAVVSPWKADTV